MGDHVLTRQNLRAVKVKAMERSGITLSDTQVRAITKMCNGIIKLL